MAQDGSRGWAHSRAGDPARVHSANETTAAELAASTNKALGTQTFELPNLAELGPEFVAEANQGHKVLVKGVLGRRANATRINVLSVGSIAAGCTQ